MARVAGSSAHRWWVLGGLVALTGLGAPVAHAETPAGVVTTLHGSADLTRAAAVQPLRFRDELHLQDQIDTTEESLVRVLLGGSAVVTVRELSSLTISEQPDRAVIDLRDGRVGVEVARHLMKPGHAIEIRTPNAIAAVRGSFVVVEVTRPEANPHTEVITRSVSLPVTVSWGSDDTSLLSDHTMAIAGSGATLRVTPPRVLTAAERARADAVRQGPREPTHSGSLPEPLEVATDEEAEKALKEAETLALQEEGGSSTSSLGLNEIAAARLVALFGVSAGEPAGLTAAPVAAAGAGLPSFVGSGAPPPSGGPPLAGPPPVGPPPVGPPPVGPPPVGPPPLGPPVPPPAVPPGAAPGFSDLAGGNATHSNASSTGLMPPAAGLRSGAPPGLAKKQ